MAVERLLEPANIPITLWNKAIGALSLPTHLSEIYVSIIESKGLRVLGEARPGGDGPVGGIDKRSTDTHFAQAFDGSVARALLAVLDPKSEVGSTSNNFIRVTAGGELVLTDAPCGAGAASFAFLSVLAELREKGVLPRHVLKVKLVAAELSEFAHEYFGEILSRLQPKLEAQAIFVDFELMKWDVTCVISTSDLVKASVRASSSKCSQLLVIANFNGFLMQSGKLKLAKPQLSELFRYATGEDSFAVWIEPHMNKATDAGGLLPAIFVLYSALRKLLGLGNKELSSLKPLHQTEAKFTLPLQPRSTAMVRLAVIPMDLTRTDP